MKKTFLFCFSLTVFLDLLNFGVAVAAPKSPIVTTQENVLFQKNENLIVPSDYFNNFITDQNKGIVVNKTQNDKEEDQNINLKKGDKTANKIAEKVSEYGNLAKGLSESEDKEQYVKSIVKGKVEGVVNNTLNKTLNEAYQGVNSQLSLTLDDEGKIRPSGKILAPLFKDYDYINYIQTGITESWNDMRIWHFGTGFRYYPFAKDLTDPGDLMLGTNIFYDHDLKRSHRRWSLGFEMMNPYALWALNVYRRISGWRDSVEDFPGKNIQERVANGWDFRSKWFLPQLQNIALLADVEQWKGDRVAPFGDVSSLEKDPLVFSTGIEWAPVPALSFKYLYQKTTEDQTNSELSLNFNLPLSNDIKDAFNPNATNKARGFSIKDSFSMFANRKYDIVLEYRATPGKFNISQCGVRPGDVYCFHIEDDFGETPENLPVNVKPKHDCVKLDNDGNYFTDKNGNIWSDIILSCTPETDLTVSAGDSQETFPIKIQELDFKVVASPKVIQLFENSVFKLSGGKFADNLKVIWKLIKGQGTLTEAQEITDANGDATVKFTPDPTLSPEQQQHESFEAEVQATVQGVDFSDTVTVKVYGQNEGDLTVAPEVIDGQSFAALTYKNLRPNSKVTFVIDGPATLTTSTQEKTGKTTITVTADNEGVATAYILGDDVKVGTAKILAKNEDPFIPFLKANVEVKNFKAEIEVPDEVVPDEEFSVILKNLKPNSDVTYYDGTHAKVQGLVSQKADETGKTEVIYKADHNYYSGVIDDIYATYYANAGRPEEKIQAKAIKVREFNPIFENDKLSFSGNDTIDLKLVNGLEGQEIQFAIEGEQNAILSTNEATFDAKGEAVIQLTGKEPYTGKVTVVATTMNKSPQVEIEYNNYFPGFKEINNTHMLYGAMPEGTIDYRTSQDIIIEDCMPDTEVIFSSTVPQIEFSQTKVTVGDDGIAKTTIAAVNDFNIDNFTVKATYNENSAVVKEITKDINLYQYTLSGLAQKTTLDAYQGSYGVKDFTYVEISGGRPDDSIESLINGNSGEIILTESDNKFDAEGKARIKIQSKEPFSGTFNLECNGVGTQIVPITFTVEMTTYDTTATVELPVYEGFNGLYPKEEDTVDYETDYQVRLSGLMPLSDLIPVTDGEAKPVESSVKVTAEGTAIVNYNAVNSYETKNLNIAFKYQKDAMTVAKIERQLPLHQYKLVLSSERDDIDAFVDKVGEFDKVSFNVKGGRPDSILQWNVTNDGEIVEQEQVFNKQGSANAVLQSKTPFEASPNVSVNSLGQVPEKTIEYDLTTYTAKIKSLPQYDGDGGIYATAKNTITYNKDYSVTLSGLLPGSRVTWKTADGVSPKTESTTVNDNGETTQSFTAISDYTKKSVNIVFTYATTANQTLTDTSLLKNIPIHQYTLSLKAADANIDAYNGNKNKLDSTLVTLSGGQPNQKINWSLVSTTHGTLSNQQATFDSKGNATATLTAKTPFTAAPQVSVAALGTTKSLTVPYQLTTYTPVVKTWPKYDGEGAYPAVDKEITYEKEYSYVVKGLLPGDTITLVKSGVIVPKTTTVTVGSNGEATLTFNAITDYNTKAVTPNFKYTSKGATVTNNNALLKTNIHQYTLAMKTVSFDDGTTEISEIVGDEKFYAIVTGGKPNAAVTWSISGDGKIVSKDAKFNAKGEAKSTVQGSGSFTNTIFLKAISNIKTLAKDINVVYPPYTISIPRYQCGDYHVELKEEIPLFQKVKKFEATIFVDDESRIIIDDETFKYNSMEGGPCIDGPSYDCFTKKKNNYSYSIKLKSSKPNIIVRSINWTGQCGIRESTITFVYN